MYLTNATPLGIPVILSLSKFICTIFPYAENIIVSSSSVTSLHGCGKNKETTKKKNHEKSVKRFDRMEILLPWQVGNVEICLFTVFTWRSSVRHLDTLILNLQPIQRLNGPDSIIRFLIIHKTEPVAVSSLSKMNENRELKTLKLVRAG